MTIGERIKSRREELKMTQEELAKKCGYKSRSSINKIELSRDLPLKKIKLMADALDTTPSYLMGWTDLLETGTRLQDKLREDPKGIVDAYIFADNNQVIEIKDDINDAVKLYELYKKADPNVKSAIDSLLKKN